MKPERVQIGHFRALINLTVDLNPMTILVGANGVGKSTVLHAIAYFFDPSAKLGSDDFHGDHLADPITVSVTFIELLSDEDSLFGRYVRNGKFTLTKKCTPDDNIGRYYAKRLACATFSEIRETTGPGPQRAMYKEFIDIDENHHKYGLPSVRTGQEALDALDAWEKAHPDQCEEIEVLVAIDGRTAQLTSNTIVRFISAVHEATEETTSARSPLQALIAKEIVRPAQSRPEIAKLLEETIAAARDLFSTAETAEIPTVEAHLNERLGEFVPGISVKLSWVDPSGLVKIGTPQVRIDVVQDGYLGEITGKGHGLQRGVIFGAMRLEVEELTKDGGTDEQHLVLLVEEPELYQHPTRARYLAHLLQQLGDEGKMTLVLATHSPYFVRLRDFASVRILRCETSAASDQIPQRVIGQTSAAGVAAKLDDAYQAGGRFSGDGVLARISGNLDASVREGYFARKVILCEGDEDVAVIGAAAAAAGLDLDGLDVAVLPVGGKDCIDKPLVVFGRLGIDTYTIFDGDHGNRNVEQHKKQNKALLRILNAPSDDFPETFIGETYAVWKENMGVSIASGFDDPTEYIETIRLVGSDLGYTVDPTKNLEVLTQTFVRLRENGRVNAVLNDLAAAIQTFARA
jgi:energy-coupling factor transporter ATP-binding protein EcfA2